MSRRFSINPLVLLVIGFAGFGFVIKLIHDPMGLIGQIFFMGIMVAIFFAIYKLFLQNRMGGMGGMSGKSNPAYQRAVKQSKMLHKQSGNAPKGNKIFSANSLATPKPQSKPNKTKRLRSLSRKNDTDRNFTVIEGKKGKKKNRAFF